MMNDVVTTLETPRLVLRPLSVDDAVVVQTWASNPKNVRFMDWGPNTMEETLVFLASAKPGRDFGVVLKASGVLIGSCGVYPDEAGDTGSLGWILHIDHWGQGYGTEAAGALLKSGFETLRLRRVVAICDADNHASYRVMEHQWMRREGLHKQARWRRGAQTWVDEVVYAMLVHDWCRN